MSPSRENLSVGYPFILYSPQSFFSTVQSIFPTGVGIENKELAEKIALQSIGARSFVRSFVRSLTGHFTF